MPRAARAPTQCVPTPVPVKTRGCTEEAIPAVPACDSALQGSGVRMLKELEAAEGGKG